MTPLEKEKIREEFYKEFVFSHAGDSGMGGNDPQEPVCEIQYENPDEIVNFFISKLASLLSERLEGKIEELAELEHEQWWKWSLNLRNTENISLERVERWRKLWVPYDKLTEEEKEQDRIWARKVLEILSASKE